MPLDRNAARWLNGFCGVVAVAAVSGLGFLVWSQRQAAESIPISSKTESLRKIKGRAHAAADRKEYPEAEKQYLAAIAADPQDKNLHENLARVYLADNKPKEAWQHLSELATDVPQSAKLAADTRAWFADLEWQFGDKKKAEALCRLATSEDWVRPRPSGKALVARMHAFTTEKSGELTPGESMKHLVRAIDLNPNSVDAHVGMANLFWQEKKRAQSLQELSVAQNLVKPADGPGSTYLAFMFSEVGKKTDADRFAQQAVRAGAAKDCHIAVALARVFATVGKSAQALQLVKQAEAGIHSPDADTLCGFAMVYAHLGKRSEAIQLLDRADKIAVGGSKARVFETKQEILNVKNG